MIFLVSSLRDNHRCMHETWFRRHHHLYCRWEVPQGGLLPHFHVGVDDRAWGAVPFLVAVTSGSGEEDHLVVLPNHNIRYGGVETRSHACICGCRAVRRRGRSLGAEIQDKKDKRVRTSDGEELFVDNCLKLTLRDTILGDMCQVGMLYRITTWNH